MDARNEPEAHSTEDAKGPKFGIVALVGRPNAGKSTLLNRLLGQKVSIVSDKPQTTRNRIVGILTESRGQIVFLDTPGIHKPLHRMNVRMMDHVRSAFAEADVISAIVDATEDFGHGDQFVVDMLAGTETPRLLLLNKIDRIKKHHLLPKLSQYNDLGLFRELIPISAATGDGVERLIDLLFELLPAGPARYPAEDYTTQPERFFAAEIVREKLLHHTRQELPYTTAVAVDRWEEDESRNLLKIYATIVVERDTQKKIVIGKGGSMIRTIGEEARKELEAVLGARIWLDLHVAVRELWREDERFLGDLEWPLG
jgi:GTPase